MKKLLSLALLLSIFASSLNADVAKAAIEPTRLAFVRIDKILNMEKLEEGAHEWRDRIKEFQADMENKQAKIMADRQRYDKILAELQNQKDSKWASDAANEAKTLELGRLKSDIESSLNYLREYQSRASQSLQMEMFGRIEKAASDIAQKQGWDSVAPFSGFYLNKRVDLTDEVITVLNKEYESQKSKKTDPKAPAAKKPAVGS